MAECRVKILVIGMNLQVLEPVWTGWHRETTATRNRTRLTGKLCSRGEG